MLVAVFVGLLLILFLLGFAVPYALMTTSVVAMLYSGSFSLTSMGTMAQKMAAGVNSFTLLAIPFFLLAGKLMNVGSITRRIFNFCGALVGWIPGGLGQVNILASVVFAGMSGSAVADAAGLGTIEIAAMKDDGFDTEFAAGITAASSTIGPIIPPSIPLIMFGCATSAFGVSISDLLVGGIVPGVVCAIALGVMVAVISLRRHYPRRKLPGLIELLRLFGQAFMSLLTPVILIGGILSGVFTATEAASVAALYAMILVCLVYREVGLKDLVRTFKEVCGEAAAIMLVVAASTLYGFMLTKFQIPTIVLNFFLSVSSSKYVFLLMINVFLLFVGCFMESNAAILIMAPILTPAAISFGVNPVHFGLIMVFNLMCGLLTPPVGMCLYATSRVAGLSFERMLKGALPFYVPLFITLVIITMVPWVTLCLIGG
ncbi:MAG: TRAP transporter large permease [Ruminococcaceae bacterium]|jgi:tripartite ATP-independent transporter DctM subunit|nr:TRAP transporter large permease [Oscillospiraceae bacterium]